MMKRFLSITLAVLLISCITIVSAQSTAGTFTLSAEAKELIGLIQKFLCLAAAVILYVVGAIASLVLIIAGVRYLTSSDPETRSGVRSLITNILTGLIIVLIAVPALNFILENIAPAFQCDLITAPFENINTAFCNLICTLEIIAPSLCALVLVYGGIKYLASGEDPGARSAARSIMVNAIIGLILVLLALPIVNLVIKDVFNTVECDCNIDTTVLEQVITIFCNFICLLLYIAPAACSLVLIYGGLRYLTSEEDPGARNKAKNIMVNAIVGLVIVLIGVAVINLIVEGIPDVEQVRCACITGTVDQLEKTLCNLICMLSYMAPALCALVLIYGGMKYLTSADDPSARNTAKNIMVNALVGLIIVLISVAIVNLVVDNVPILGKVKCGCFKGLTSPQDINKVFCSFICVIESIAPAAAALVIAYAGLRYLTSEDDPSARASARTTLISAIVGLIIIMIAVPTVNLVLMNNLRFQCDCLNTGTKTVGTPHVNPPVQKCSILAAADGPYGCKGANTNYDPWLFVCRKDSDGKYRQYYYECSTDGKEQCTSKQKDCTNGCADEFDCK